MSPAWIRRRENTTRRTYQVLYRRGGRGYPIETAGTFRTEREAKLRRDLISGWLAQGLNPRDELARLAAAPPVVRDLAAWADSWLASRIDIASSTLRQDRSALAALTVPLGARDPQSLAVADLQTVIAGMTVQPSSVRIYVTKWQMLLDYAGVDPNPARSKHLRLPVIATEEVNPPTAAQLLATLERVPRPLHLPLVTLEQTGMRVGELEQLAWGDVDEQGARFRLRARSTKTRRARWVQVPAWLMPVIAATCPVEDRAPDRRVFPRFTQAAARKALATACAAAGVPYFTPHDLRHRRATIWHHDGLPTRVLMERGGWTRSDIPIEVYAHLVPLDEAPVEALERLLVMPA